MTISILFLDKSPKKMKESHNRQEAETTETDENMEGNDKEKENKAKLSESGNEMYFVAFNHSHNIHFCFNCILSVTIEAEVS